MGCEVQSVCIKLHEIIHLTSLSKPVIPYNVTEKVRLREQIGSAPGSRKERLTF